MAVTALPPERLARRTDPATLDFRSTAELEGWADALGQERALEALKFGLGIRREGYNLFGFGPSGLGKHHMVQTFAERQAAREPAPSDWCYVHNFAEPHKPNAIKLPPGRGRPLRDDMARLIDEMRAALPAAFESDDYRAQRQAIEDQLKARHQDAFGALQEKAQAKNIALIRTPMGLALAPVREGEVLGPEEFERLPEKEQQETQRDLAELQEELQVIMRQAPQWEREHRRRVRELNREVMRHAVGHLIGEVKARYAELPEVIKHLEAVEADMVENAQDFLRPEGAGAAGPMLAMLPGVGGTGEPPSFARYQVNAIVDHGDAKGAPVVYENHPNHPNLMGRVEHRAQFGALVTDFNLIKPGALHRANGGYLILDARKVLMQPFAWEELKRALRSREIRIESPAQSLGLLATVTLEPEPIPLDLKVVLLGERWLYYLLAALDPDFNSLFKVPMDFDERISRNADNGLRYARLIAGMAAKEKMRPFGRDAVARIMDQAARLAEDGEKLSTHLEGLRDLLRESDWQAGQRGVETVSAKDVEDAIAGQIRRSDRLRERLQEEIERGTILIDTAGEKIGQVNGLSVIQLGGYAFGRPSRITASVALGRGEFVDIEREVALGGPIHAKGVLILQGYLRTRFGAERPLALKASLVFEQSYGGVEGDSASSAELYALLSAIGRLPIRQCYAVTGSVNQKGEVQAIGGANEKIEGYFDLCKARGLDGTHGVLIPASNVKHLMLRNEVVEAAAQGRFHIYPIETIDQGVEILTGVPAGAVNEKGEYPEGSVNFRVQAELNRLVEAARKYTQPAKENQS